MKKIIFIIFLLFSYNGLALAAIDCQQYAGDNECIAAPGCIYSSGNCKSCEAGTYSPGGENTCKPCPEGYANSSEGSGKQEQCYKTCGNKPDFANGTWKPDSEKVYAPNGQCTYEEKKITCNDDTNQCDGYHKEGDACKPNRRECPQENLPKEAKAGIQFWNGTKYSECYITECSLNYHLENTKETSCGDTYGTCEEDNEKCQKELRNCSGTIAGDAPWNFNAHRRDYSKCTCTIQGYNIDNGKGERTCSWKSDTGTKTQWHDEDEYCTTTVTSCYAGYCLTPNDTNANSCDPAPRGYYHQGSSTKDCDACPAGSTSNGTVTGTDDTVTLATSKSACHIVRGTNGTKFCDGAGCFTLPGKGNIPWKGQ